MSSYSRNIAAGSRMSANFAVAVMNCSCTHTNKSSRPSPRATAALSGATLAELAFCMSIALTGGPPSSAEASPQEAALGGAVEPREGFDFVHGEAGDQRGPLRSLVGEVRFDGRVEVR